MQIELSIAMCISDSSSSSSLTYNNRTQNKMDIQYIFNHGSIWIASVGYAFRRWKLRYTPLKFMKKRVSDYIFNELFLDTFKRQQKMKIILLKTSQKEMKT